MRPVGAELVESREIVRGRWLQAYHAPAIVPGVRPGQYVHARSGDWSGLVGRRPLPIASADRATGTLAVEVAAGGREREWWTRLRPGDRVDLVGPLGRPFELDPRSRHLLLVAEGAGIAGLRLLADRAVGDGRSVVLLYGARSSGDVYPSSLLPDEVEYVVATEDGSLGRAGSVIELVREYEAWADQSFASGPTELLAALTRLAAGRRARLGVATLGRKRRGGRVVAPGSPEARRRSFLQVAVEQTIGCAAGTCLACVVPGASGPVRACREGPVFAADELALDDAP